MKRSCALVSSLAVLLAGSAAHAQADFGDRTQKTLERRTSIEFGFGTPLATQSGAVARAAGQPASTRQTLAAGLTASYVARNLAFLPDMIAF